MNEKELPTCRLEQAVGSHAPGLALEPTDLTPLRLVCQGLENFPCLGVWLGKMSQVAPECAVQHAQRYGEGHHRVPWSLAGLFFLYSVLIQAFGKH